MTVLIYNQKMLPDLIFGLNAPPFFAAERSAVFLRPITKPFLLETAAREHPSVPTDRPNEDDVPSTGLNVLSFFFPIVGLILFCVFYTRTPKKAAAVGKWALISVGVSAALWLILAISGVSILSML